MVAPAAPTPLPDADAVADALAATWALMAEHLDAGWARRSGGVTTLVTGVPIPPLNGVWVTRPDADPAVVEAELADVAGSEVPHCLESRPGWREHGDAIATRRGMVAEPDIPLMVAGGPVQARAAADLALRALGRREADLHVKVAAPAFGAPPDLLAQITDPVLGLPQIGAYIGEVGGEGVVTGMSVTIGDAVGVFNIATLESHRRRGYGAALTAWAVADGVRRGASWAWLQSTEAGFGVYEQLGFVTLERWPCWVSAS